MTWEPKSHIAAEMVEAFEAALLLQQQQHQQQDAAAVAGPMRAAEPVRPASPSAEKRPRAEDSAISPSAKSPEPMR